MTTQQLKARLYTIARQSLGEANKQQPFVMTRSQAMSFINVTRQALR